MTRINLVPPSELHNKHLMGELHELTRVYGLVRKAQARGINKYNMSQKLSIPTEYTMGKGHVLFFYNKLKFLTERYEALCEEAVKRGFNINKIDAAELTSGINDHWKGDYKPTPKAIAISRQRIAERTKPEWT